MRATGAGVKAAQLDPRFLERPQGGNAKPRATSPAKRRRLKAHAARRRTVTLRSVTATLQTGAG